MYTFKIEIKHPRLLDIFSIFFIIQNFMYFEVLILCTNLFSKFREISVKFARVISDGNQSFKE